MGMLRRDFSRLLGLSVGTVWATGCSTGDPAISTPPQPVPTAATPTYVVGTQKKAFTDSAVFRIDSNGHKVVKLLADGSDGLTLGEIGTAAPPTLNYPVAIETTKSGQILVLERGSSCITVFDKDGKELSQIGKAGTGPRRGHLARCVVYERQHVLMTTVFALEPTVLTAVEMDEHAPRRFAFSPPSIGLALRMSTNVTQLVQ